jgi:chromate transporter
MREVLDVFLTFLRLGCTSFGGPVAHLAYFRREFVERRGWLGDGAFGECIALTQLLPGPSSSQTGMLIGWLRAGFPGALAAWIAFTLPSAFAMTLAAIALPHLTIGTGVLHGLLLVAAAVVASAIVSMRATLAPDPTRVLIAIAVCVLVLAITSQFAVPLAIAAAACAGLLFLRTDAQAESHLELRLSRRAGIAAIVLLVAAYVVLALWAQSGSRLAILTNVLFRIGSLVFGGGHIVLPLLQTQAVAAGIVDSRTILAGYALAQAMPGPLFTIASYTGAAAWNGALGVTGAIAGTIAIFAPSFFLITAVVPFYQRLASNVRVRAALAGANAGVVGLLAAAFVNPVFRTAVHTALDGIAALVAFAALHYAKIPAWAMVLLGLLYGYVMER